MTTNANHTDGHNDLFKVGDVIYDSYANPAVIVRLDHKGEPSTIMQTCGSDRGHITSAPGYGFRNVPGPRRVPADRCDLEAVRAIARDEAKRRGLKWDRATGNLI